MIKLGDIIEVEVEKMTYKGAGLCRLGEEKFVVFVPCAVAGDKLKVRIISLNKKHAMAEILEIIEPSPHRIKPLCPIYNACGGCGTGEWEYEFLLNQKRIVLIDTFKNIIDEEKIYPVIKAKKIFPSRYKVQYGAAQTKNSRRIILGYFKKNTHDLTDIKFCPIQPGISNLIAKFIRENFPFDCLNQKTQKGLLKNVLLRINSKMLEVSLVFVLNMKKNIFSNIEDEMSIFSKKIMAQFPEIKGTFVNFNPDKTNSILGSETIKIKGQDFITEQLGDKIYKVGAVSFFQVNPEMAIELFNVVKENIEINSNILDAYGGVGAIGIWASEKAKKITLVEQNQNAVLMAEENFKINKIKDYEILSGDTKIHFLNFKRDKRNFDCTILDPPRAGCEKEALDDIAVVSKKIIYVSCNPQTLKRDVEYLSAFNFKPKFIQGVDLFPLTYHIECVCVLEKEKNGN